MNKSIYELLELGLRKKIVYVKLNSSSSLDSIIKRVEFKHNNIHNIQLNYI